MTFLENVLLGFARLHSEGKAHFLPSDIKRAFPSMELLSISQGVVHVFISSMFTAWKGE